MRSLLHAVRKVLFPTKEEKQEVENDKINHISRKRFYSSFISKGDLCYDVGANIGNRTSVFLEIGAKVIAVEPQTSCFKILEKRFKNKIILVKKGLSAREEKREFFVSNASTISSFSSEWIDSVKTNRFKTYKWESGGEIEMTTLDNLIKNYGKPKFIKIDVEGFELEVLKGLSESIDMISIEYSVPENAQKAIDCINQLQTINPDLKCNYCIGENMAFTKVEWIEAEKMKELIRSEEFIATDFGDIYIKQS